MTVLKISLLHFFLAYVCSPFSFPRQLGFCRPLSQSETSLREIYSIPAAIRGWIGTDTFFYRHFLSGITKKSLNAFYYACSYAKVDCSGFMNVTAKIALHLIPESLKSQPVFIRFAGIEISYYEQKTFWSLCSYMVRSCKGIEMMINLINITYCGMKLLSYQDEKFSDYRDKSVQDFRFALSECIRQQVFFATFVKNIETRIKSSSVINALKRAIVKQEHYFIKLFVCPPLNELILN